MCLDKVTKTDFDPSEEVVAYKLFYEHPIYPNAYSSYIIGNGRIYKKNVWINEKDYRGCDGKDINVIHLYPKGCYEKGFHAYKYNREQGSVNELSPLKLLKVKLRKLVAEGKTGEDEIIVAKEMFITDEEIQ